MISLSSLESMTQDERWKLIDDHPSVRVKPTVKPCKPDWLSVLLSNTPMPHFKTERTTILLDEDNVYNGILIFEDWVTMRWNGYVCRLYDGELKMCPIEPKSWITGVCNGILFKFNGTDLEYGVLPGFLLLYKKI
jgi:hypothetical protein